MVKAPHFRACWLRNTRLLLNFPPSEMVWKKKRNTNDQHELRRAVASSKLRRSPDWKEEQTRRRRKKNCMCPIKIMSQNRTWKLTRRLLTRRAGCQNQEKLIPVENQNNLRLREREISTSLWLTKLIFSFLFFCQKRSQNTNSPC